MASQSLYRKWRSQNFDDLVGQEPITRTLKNALKSDNLSHAYLFTGPRGTGKTSTARLLAKTVNCPNAKDGEPCNECQQCREITAGNSFNVIEIDAASNRGIDSIRELREKVMVPPSTGKYKIYILDEAHMLTTEAFNALLKTLEEPPDYAIFVMATTDVQKMLPTVLSRCQRFDFKRISTRQIVQHVLFVAREEKVEIERSAAELIARAATGGMRDALSLLDQAIAYAGETISLAQVQSMLGVADPRAISRLLTHIANQDNPALLYEIHGLSEAGADLRQVNAQIVEYWRALMLARAGADVATILDLTEDEVQEVKQLMSAFTLEELTIYARIFAQNELVQKNQGTPQLGLELAALECSEHRQRAQSTQPALQPTVHKPVHITEPVRTPAPQVTQPRAFSAPTPAPAPTPATTSIPLTTQQTAKPEIHVPQAEQMVTPPQTNTSTRSSEEPILSLRQVSAAWESVKKRTKQKSNLLGTYIGLCDVVGVERDGDQTIIIVRAAKPAHLKFIREEERPKEVEWALSTEFNIPCKFRILPPDQPYVAPDTHTPDHSRGTMGQSHSTQQTYRTEEMPSSLPKQTHNSNEIRYPTDEIRHSTEQDPEISYRHQVEPLARKQRVEENKKVVLSPEELEHKVEQDPVVKEALKTFRATIADIQPK